MGVAVFSAGFEYPLGDTWRRRLVQFAGARADDDVRVPDMAFGVANEADPDRASDAIALH